MDIIKLGIEHYGRDIQQIVCMEELSELQKEISKVLRGIGNIDHLTEEIADVVICIETLKEIHSISDEAIQGMLEGKLARLKFRIREERK